MTKDINRKTCVEHEINSYCQKKVKIRGKKILYISAISSDTKWKLIDVSYTNAFYFIVFSNQNWYNSLTIVILRMLGVTPWG